MMDAFSGADKPNPRIAMSAPKAVSSQPAKIADGILRFSTSPIMASLPPSMLEPACCRRGLVAELGRRGTDRCLGLRGDVGELPEGRGGESAGRGGVLDFHARGVGLRHGLSPFFPLK
jgi:hypothetical protein